MGAYRLTQGSAVVRTADGAVIPDDPNNGDRHSYVDWIEAGNVPDPAIVVPLPAPLVTGRQINGQASVAGITLALNVLLTAPTVKKPDDIRYFNSVGLDTCVPVDNPKVARVLGLAGVIDVPAFMAAALLLPA